MTLLETLLTRELLKTVTDGVSAVVSCLATAVWLSLTPRL